MKNKTAIIVAVGTLLAIVAYFSGNGGDPVVGSLSEGSAYNATSTSASYANSKVVLKLGQGVLGSVVITGTSATVVELRNATSSTDVGSTSIATFVASVGAGTYTFDSAFDRGLVINSIGSFAGQYTVTYR